MVAVWRVCQCELHGQTRELVCVQTEPAPAETQTSASRRARLQGAVVSLSYDIGVV